MTKEGKTHFGFTSVGLSLHNGFCHRPAEGVCYIMESDYQSMIHQDAHFNTAAS